MQVVANSQLDSFYGLENLKKLERLTAGQNDQLTSLTGMEALDSISVLQILENPVLVNFTGLSGLSHIETELFVRANKSLKSLKGMDAFLTAGGKMYADIGENPAITDLGALGNLLSLGGLTIKGNNSLVTLAGINELQTLSMNLVIFKNPNLQSISNLKSIHFIGGDFNVVGNPKLGTDNVDMLLNTILNSGQILGNKVNSGNN